MYAKFVNSLRAQRLLKPYAAEVIKELAGTMEGYAENVVFRI
jgi:hypothetical protein